MILRGGSVPSSTADRGARTARAVIGGLADRTATDRDWRHGTVTVTRAGIYEAKDCFWFVLGMVRSLVAFCDLARNPPRGAAAPFPRSRPSETPHRDDLDVQRKRADRGARRTLHSQTRTTSFRGVLPHTFALRPRHLRGHARVGVRGRRSSAMHRGRPALPAMRASAPKQRSAPSRCSPKRRSPSSSSE